jgi:hypothetical protein
MEVVCMDDPEQAFVKAFPGTIWALGPGLSGYGYASRYIPWLKENKHNYDAVIVHGLWQYPGFGTWSALHKDTTPYVVFAHGMLDPWFKEAYPFRHFKKSLYWGLAEHRVLQDARAVLFTSREEAVAASQTFQPYERIVYSPVSPSFRAKDHTLFGTSSRKERLSDSSICLCQSLVSKTGSFAFTFGDGWQWRCRL